MKLLPYEFDLLYDIKEYYEIEMVLKGEPTVQTPAHTN
jgi:hypothetical protein